ncbi:hypothetical protein J6590_087954, partial [Homalodisca vitripennis]
DLRLVSGHSVTYRAAAISPLMTPGMVQCNQSVYILFTGQADINASPLMAPGMVQCNQSA